MNVSTRYPLSRAALALGLLALAAPLAGCSRKAEAAMEPAAPPVHVETATIKAEPVRSYLLVTGTLRGDRETDLAANAAGRVLATSFERGMEIKEGALLARLDTRAAALSVAEAQASAALARTQQESARRECDRYASLLAKGAVSAAENDQVADRCRTSGSSVAAAVARVQSAAQMVGDGLIRAPFSGVISERHVEVGQYVRQDSLVATIVSLDPLRLSFSVAEADVGRVQAGNAVRFAVPAFPGRSFEGTVRFVDARVRAASRDLLAEAIVPNADRTLRPGMFAAVSLDTGASPTPVVPREAILTREGRPHVFVVRGGHAEEGVLQLGDAQGAGFAVRRGLAEGDQVVVAPPAGLRNGQGVN
jgi:RND family efflux transporter MFP subunit